MAVAPSFSGKFGRDEVGWETSCMAYVTGAAAPSDRLQNDDIGLDRRLELFRLQVEIRLSLIHI